MAEKYPTYSDEKILCNNNELTLSENELDEQFQAKYQEYTKKALCLRKKNLKLELRVVKRLLVLKEKENADTGGLNSSASGNVALGIEHI